MTPRVLIFDLDGTLTPSKSALTPEVGEALTMLLKKMPVAVMSGGAFTQFEKQFLTGMPSGSTFNNLYLFPTSAAQCYTWRNGSWEQLYSHPLTPAEKERVMRAFDEAFVETNFTQPTQIWGEQLEDRGSQITWSALGQKAPYDIKKDWDPDRTKRAPVQVALLKRLPDFSVRVNASNSIDISHAGITKAFGIRELSKLLQVPISDMLYVGDALFPGGNDEIVKETGVPTQEVSGPEDTLKLISSLL